MLWALTFLYCFNPAAAILRASAARAAFLATAPPLVNATDCLMRSYFLQRAMEVNPALSAPQLRAMVDALVGDPSMGAGCTVAVPPPMPGAPLLQGRAVPAAAAPTVVVFADAAAGNDATGTGSLAAPFLTVARAVAAVRAAAAGGGTVNLRGGGTFHLPATLALTPADSGLTIQTYPGDGALAWLSGALPLTAEAVAWEAVNLTGSANIWRADLSRVPGLAARGGVAALRLAGARLIRARFPNGNPETSLPFAHRAVTARSWTPVPAPSNGQAWSAPGNWSRNDTAGMCANYAVAIGGTSCGLFTPAISHFCGGGQVPVGVAVGQDELPHLPYANPTGAVVTAMHGGSWCSFQYAVGGFSFDNATGVGRFAFSSGGQQCGRPEASHGPFIIENVLEELDAPGEFHWDAGTQVLTLWHNATSGTPPPSDGTLSVPLLPQLVAAAGSQSRPVASLVFSNLGFRDTPPTSFAPHLAPSGSDYAVNREAALSLVGVSGVVVSNCTFLRLDNSAVFIGGFARGVVVEGSEFAWLGENGIVSVGDTAGAPVPGWGPDGSGGDQPRGTVVARNFAHELGIVNKQSCFYFQAVSSGAQIDGNVVFNGARHGIQYNDDFGEGSVLSNTVAFNLNRETADTGLFVRFGRR